jgi:MFS family permease
MLATQRSTTSFFDRSILPWLICSIGMLFYCYNYFLRVSPSVMQNDLMQNFHISASQFGNLAAFYYYAYTPMQIPVGMIYDRFGAKLVLFFACIIAVTGLSVFIRADNLMAASAGRFLVGFGSAFAYIGVLKLASLWLPANRFATIAGLTTAFGMAAAGFSAIYLTEIVQLLGYKNALYTALTVGAALSVFIVIFMRNKPISELSQPGTIHKPMSFYQLLYSVKVILSKPQMWLIGIIGCLFYLPASVFLDLWGIPFLESVYHLTPKNAAFVILSTFGGWIIAGPSIGALSDKIKRRRAPLLVCAVMAAILFSAIFYIPTFTLSELYVIFFFIGIFCGAHPLCFALGKENNSNAISGTAVAITNTLIMIGGAIFQPIVGKLLDWHTSGAQTPDGVLIYTSGDYLYALSVVPIGLVIAIGLTFFLKETYCESHEDVIAMQKQNTPTNVISLQTN